MKATRFLKLCVLLAVISLALACGKKQEPSSVQPAPTSVAATSPALRIHEGSQEGAAWALAAPPGVFRAYGVESTRTTTGAALTSIRQFAAASARVELGNTLKTLVDNAIRLEAQAHGEGHAISRSLTASAVLEQTPISNAPISFERSYEADGVYIIVVGVEVRLSSQELLSNIERANRQVIPQGTGGNRRPSDVHARQKTLNADPTGNIKVDDELKAFSALLRGRVR